MAVRLCDRDSRGLAVHAVKAAREKVICGENKALVVDAGNNYIDGYGKDLIVPRKNAAEELLSGMDGWAGKLPLEVTVTHVHPHQRLDPDDDPEPDFHPGNSW